MYFLNTSGKPSTAFNNFSSSVDWKIKVDFSANDLRSVTILPLSTFSKSWGVH